MPESPRQRIERYIAKCPQCELRGSRQFRCQYHDGYRDAVLEFADQEPAPPKVERKVGGESNMQRILRESREEQEAEERAAAAKGQLADG